MAPSKDNECSKLITAAFPSHCKCSTHHGCTKAGSFLNQYSSLIHFNDDEKYKICYNMQFNFQKNRIPKCNQLPIISIPSEPLSLDLPAPATREDRVRIRDAKASVEGLVRKFSELADQNEALRQVAGGKEMKRMRKIEPAPAVLPQPQPQQLPLHQKIPQELKKKTQQQYIPFHDRISLDLKRFRKCFKDLSFKSRIGRVDEICSLIIAACIDKSEEDEEYYVGNEEFGNEVLNIVAMIRHRLSIKLKVNLSLIDNPEICELIDDDEEDNEDYAIHQYYLPSYKS